MSSPLSRRERHALERMVHHECRHDPAFVERLTSWSEPEPEPEPEPGSEPRNEPEPGTQREAGTVPRSGPGRPATMVGVVLVSAVLLGLAASGYAVLAAALAVAIVMLPLALHPRSADAGT